MHYFFFSSVFKNQTIIVDSVNTYINDVSPKEPLWLTEDQIQKSLEKLHVNKSSDP